MKSCSWCRRRLAAAALAVVIGVLPTPLAAQPLPAIFVSPAHAADARVAVPPNVTRARRVALRTDLLAAALASDADARPPFVLNLFDDVVLEIERERREEGVHGYRSWVGHVAGDDASAASFTWTGGALVGSVVTRGVAYDLVPDSAGAVVVRELAPRAGPTELAARVPPGTAPPLRAGQLAPPSAEPAVVDVYVIYTAAARVKAGGTSAMIAAVANGIAVTNTAFQRSGVHAEIRAVGVTEAPYIEAAVDPADLTEPILKDLFVISPGGAASAAVESVRASSGADLVALITGRTDGAACGVAWLGPQPAAAYSVTEQECLFAGQWSFSHELAHNFGADHAPGDNGPGYVPNPPYAQGYRAGAIRTLMAYAVAGSPPRALNYSSATVREPAGSGAATGTGLQDNARRLNETAPSLAAYRTAATPPPPPDTLTAEVAGTTVTLAWTPATSDGTIESFVLEAGPAPGSAAYGSAALAASPLIVTNVPPGAYYLRLRSVGPGGVSAATPDAVAVVNEACVAPGPTTLSAVVVGTTATLAFSASPGSAAVSYYVGIGTTPGVDDDVYPMGPATTLTGTAAAGIYYARAVALNACGAGPVSATVTVTIP